jgi:hypothetical protein
VGDLGFAIIPKLGTREVITPYVVLYTLQPLAATGFPVTTARSLNPESGTVAPLEQCFKRLYVLVRGVYECSLSFTPVLQPI